MSELILHHYDTSPFSEKVKKILAHKRLPWRAVEQPTIMPKPQLIPLTGGYRRIPVLQIGADVYCDSQLIAQVLEARHPSPTIYPGAMPAACHAMALWADRTFFMAAVPVLFALIGDAVPQAFIDDRTKLMGGGRVNFADVPKQAAAAREQLRACAALLDAQLEDGRPFLFGDAFSLADAASYHPVWFLRNFPGAGVIFDEYTALLGWAERIQAMGHGARQDMDSGEALAVARDSRPVSSTVDGREPNGLAAGARVTVTPDDYGFDPVEGELVGSSAHEIAVRRSAAEVGDVVVHFPRIGFRVAPA
jgi:glutathione S-transferase